MKKESMKKCLNCGKEFKPRGKGTIKEQKFCCLQCRTRYNSRKQRNNPSNNEASKKYYRNNKNKCNSRTITRRLVHEGKVKLIEKCKKCKGLNYLQIHHEIYPTKIKEIKKAIKNGKIYYLCKKCHGEERRKPIDRKVTALKYKKQNNEIKRKYKELFDYMEKKCNFKEIKTRSKTKKDYTWNCDGKLTFVRQFCEENKLDFQKVKKRLGDTGGYCDCEVILNSAERIKGSEEIEK